MSNEKLYDIWSDGSFNHSHQRGGAGWVIEYQGVKTEHYEALVQLPAASVPHGSDYAELKAVELALKNIPEGSVVNLRMDCQNVIDWLKAGTLKGKKETVSALQSVFDKASNAMRKMETVEIIKISGRTNEDFNKAHELSKIGSNRARSRR